MGTMRELYTQVIMDHCQRPRNKGELGNADLKEHLLNPLCGDEVTVYAVFDGGKVADARFEGRGCSISQASTSVLTDLLIGKKVDDALEIHSTFVELMQSRGKVEPDEDILEDGIAFAGVAKFPGRVKCALLGWMAWKDATARVVVDVEGSVT